MTQTNCPNCGAVITGPKCEYCGTVFDEPEMIVTELHTDEGIYIEEKQEVSPYVGRWSMNEAVEGVKRLSEAAAKTGISAEEFCNLVNPIIQNEEKEKRRQARLLKLKNFITQRHSKRVK